MARQTAAAKATPKERAPSAAQVAAAVRYLARETKREAEVAQLLGDEVKD